MIYRHKPFEVYAEEYDGTPEMNRKIIKASKHSKTPAFMDRSGPKALGDDLMSAGVLTINTPQGPQPVYASDYIVQGMDGSLCAMPKEYFEATYEPLLPLKPTMPLYGLDGKRLN